MKQILPTDIDLTDYETEDLNKQLELETVLITLTKETNPDSKPQDYKRVVARMENQEGKFERLQRELQKIGQEYEVEMS